MVTPDPLFEHIQQTLGDSYALERELGGGGMARVFLATESRLNRRVVIKVLPPEAASLFTAGRFWRETEICARIQHPHVVPLLASGEIEGVPWFTMPFIEGESLRDRLTRDGALPVPEVTRLLAEAADALDCAHAMGVVHRDIKPENILLSHGHALVADFGVAKAFEAVARESRSAVTTAGIALGTPAYMAPEQAMGDPGVDRRADLYALGVVAWEMLTGQRLFGTESPMGVVSAHLTKTPPVVETIRSDCPPALSALIVRLLAKEPDARPASAGLVRDELRAMVSGAAPAAVRPRATGYRLAVGAVLVIAAGALLLPRLLPVAGRAVGAPTPEAKSVAVLPFDYVGRDSSGSSLGVGLAYELISSLGRLPGLKVASQTSSFALKAKGLGLAEIGKGLGVGAVLEGVVQQVEDRLHVTARLVAAANDSVLWSESFDERASNVFAVQEHLAQAIAGQLRVQLVSGGAPIVARGTADPVAHDHYLLGLYFTGLRTNSDLHRAIQEFEAATARDSSYALAWAGLASAYSLLGGFGDLTPHQAFPRARVAAERAFALDSTQAEVQTAVGMIELFYDWKWAAAGVHLRRAVAINPSYAQGHLFYAWQLLVTRSRDSALAEILHARELDPYSLIISARVGLMYHYLGRDAEAETAIRRGLAIDPQNIYAKSTLTVVLLSLGRNTEALEYAVGPGLVPGTYESAERAFGLARAGDTAAARRELKALEATSTQRYLAADGLAIAYLALGERELALKSLERAEREHAFTLLFMDDIPEFIPLRSEPRYQAILRHLRGG